jgi:hypothetical protein
MANCRGNTWKDLLGGQAICHVCAVPLSGMGVNFVKALRCSGVQRCGWMGMLRLLRFTFVPSCSVHIKWSVLFDAIDGAHCRLHTPTCAVQHHARNAMGKTPAAAIASCDCRTVGCRKWTRSGGRATLQCDERHGTSMMYDCFLLTLAFPCLSGNSPDSIRQFVRFV